jgi:sulfatase maturation enzyme AslB (radical SAM superfamily)
MMNTRSETEALRGWLKLPWAAVDYKTGRTRFLKRAEFEELAAQEGLADWQKYRLYNNRYMKSAMWSITGRCNYRCKHCYLYAGDAKYGELPTPTMLDIARQIAECGIMRVSLSGGEPLVRSDFWEIADALLDRRVIFD